MTVTGETPQGVCGAALPVLMSQGTGENMSNLNTTCHRDGTVTYWSVYEERWRRRIAHIPDRELAAMGEAERVRVMRHLEAA